MKTATASAATVPPSLVRESFLRTSQLMSLGITVEFLQGLQQAVAMGNDTGARALYRIGRFWGQGLYERLDQFMHERYQQQLSQLPIEELQRLLMEHIETLGWGRCLFDLEAFSELGLMLVTVSGGPANQLNDALSPGVAMLLAGFFSGILTSVADIPIEGYGLCSVEGAVAVTHVVMAHESRLGPVRSVWEERGGLSELLSRLRA